MIPALMMGLGALGKLYGVAEAGVNSRRARRQLSALGNEPLPTYTVNPAISRLYSGALGEAASPTGYTGAEKAAFRQNIASGLNTQAYNARSMAGGNMGRALAGVLSGNQLNAYNQFASQDAQLARSQRNAALSRLLGLSGTMQNVQNMNTQAALNRRLMQEQMLGQAISSNRAYRTGTLGSLGSDLLTGGIMTGMNGGFGLDRLGRKISPIVKQYLKYTPPSEWVDTPELPR